MFGRIGHFHYTLRRWLSRSEWGVRLLGLPRTPPGAGAGLILVQIDGLSRPHLEDALLHGRMPFLARLLGRDHYRLHSLYAGVPSTTPEFQARLFYGVSGAVPAFGFRDRDSGELARMYDPESAARVQRRLESAMDEAAGGDGNGGLLDGGSCYSSIYTGGAAESHVCPAAFGFGTLIRAANPLLLTGLVLWNGVSLLRALALVVVEALLAVMDALRGAFAGRDLWRELQFIPTRAAISIGLREAVTIGACMDAARGLAVIHVNLLGYDEQAHRRGPGSRFAHWTLKGIDRAIHRIDRAAHLSRSREYQLWVYSDHGQEESIPYPRLYGRPLEEAVCEALRQPPSGAATGPGGEEYRRAGWLGKRLSRWLKGASEPARTEASPRIVAMGPVGLVYLDAPPPPEQAADLARRLLTEARIPAVLVPSPGGKARLFTPEGDLAIPAEAHRYLGDEHPFRQQVACDLARLAHQPDAGHLILLGWRRGAPTLTFPSQNGAHGGPGTEETHAFALLPADTALPPRADRSPVEAADLRRAALALLGRATPPPRPTPPDISTNVSADTSADISGRTSADAPTGFRVPRSRPARVRVMTYNVHGCVGLDGRLSPARIARVIDTLRPDVACLQELDVGRSRSGRVDQARLIADLLQMEFHFAPTLSVQEEHYGNAVLSRLPMQRVRAAALPGTSGGEPRGALWVRLHTPHGMLNLINTHLGLYPAERRPQAAALAGPHWVGHPEFSAPGVVCGDFNAMPGTLAYRHMTARLVDAQRHLPGHSPRATWYGPYPVGRIDHVFLTPEVRVHRVEVPRSGLTRTASDHLPLVVDLELPGA